MRPVACLFIVALCLSANIVTSAHADTFGSGANSFAIDFVTIGNPGNPPDANPNPAGAVPYEYRMGKYEISEQMIDKANAVGGLGITKDTRGPDMPATSVTWYEAARFVNWLNTSSGSLPAYKFDDGGNYQLWTPIDPGYNPSNMFRNSFAKYFLPSVDEWHKAAYYDPVAHVYYDYPTGSDSIPDGIDFVGDPNFEAVFDDGADNPAPNIINDVGLFSPFGTAGQGGNVFEWEETSFDRSNNLPSEDRHFRGGSWTGGPSILLWTNGSGFAPTVELGQIGFRVVSVVPEPNSIALLILAVGASQIFGKRRSRPLGTVIRKESVR
jgi:sulfatase modifying factor 1